MSNLRSDESCWPLAILVLEGEQSLEQHLELLAIWDRWFARGERFVSLRLYLDASSLDHVPGTARATKAWMKDGADARIRETVSAMVMVIPPERYDAMKHLSVEAVFGVPGSICASADDAFDWIALSAGLEPTKVEAARTLVLSRYCPPA